MLQTDGFSPVCTLVCLSKSHNLRNSLAQTSHLKVFVWGTTFWRTWTGLCSSKALIVLNSSLHFLQTYGRLPTTCMQ
jgi:hypothetical protein